MGWIGEPLLRREDLPLLTGRGCFVDDVQVANPLHVAFARSPWAHARIASVDLSAALALPGVAGALEWLPIAAWLLAGVLLLKRRDRFA